MPRSTATCGTRSCRFPKADCRANRGRGRAGQQQGLTMRRNGEDSFVNVHERVRGQG